MFLQLHMTVVSHFFLEDTEELPHLFCEKDTLADANEGKSKGVISAVTATEITSFLIKNLGKPEQDTTDPRGLGYKSKIPNKSHKTAVFTLMFYKMLRVLPSVQIICKVYLGNIL